MIKHILLIIISLFFSVGCTVKYSFTGASISPDVKTFSIQEVSYATSPIEPNLSDEFTEALKDKFLKETSLRMVSDAGDLDFNGRITGYQISFQAVQTDENAALNRLTISVAIEFHNSKEEGKDFSTTFSGYEEYRSEENLDDVKAELKEKIIKKIVDDIFLKAVADW